MKNLKVKAAQSLNGDMNIIMVSPTKQGDLLQGSAFSMNPKIKRCTLWMFEPGLVPRDRETWLDLKPLRMWSKSLHPLGTFKRASKNLELGTYHMVAHVPNEPGSVGGDTIAACAFEVVA